MSNAQLATEMLAAYQRGDRDGLVALIDPRVEVHGQDGQANAGTYTGVDGFWQWTGQWEEAWEDTTYELVELSELGDGFVVGAVRVKGIGRGSGVPTKAVFGYLWEIHDGRTVRFHTYESHEMALRRARELMGGSGDEEGEES